MPFPLAHPAAVLPLRRQCPRRLSFPALVIGSLCPDAGYCFGRLHLDRFSHRFLAGSFGFCLPLGLVLVLLLYLVRWPAVQRLPPAHRRIFEPLCLEPVGSPLAVVASLLIGSWTHIFLDSLTHQNGWFVEHLPFLQVKLALTIGQARVSDLLYAAFTFAGVVYVGLACLNRLERDAGNPGWRMPGYKWASVLLFAVLTLVLAIANHQVSSSLGLVAVGALTLVLVAVSFLLPGWALRGGQSAGGKLRSGGRLEAQASNKPQRDR